MSLNADGMWTPTLVHPSQQQSDRATILFNLVGAGPERLTETRRLFRRAFFAGMKNGTTVNSGDIFFGSATLQNRRITAGNSIEVANANGEMPDNLADYWFRGTAGDGIVVSFADAQPFVPPSP